MTREEFMDIVYAELHSDGDNNRANRIIDAADEYADECAHIAKKREDGNMSELLSEQQINAIISGDEIKKEAYDRGVAEGRKEAWEAARKIVCQEFIKNLGGGFFISDIKNVVGVDCESDVFKMEVGEVLEKIAAYESKEKAGGDQGRG